MRSVSSSPPPTVLPTRAASCSGRRPRPTSCLRSTQPSLGASAPSPPCRLRTSHIWSCRTCRSPARSRPSPSPSSRRLRTMAPPSPSLSSQSDPRRTATGTVSASTAAGRTPHASPTRWDSTPTRSCASDSAKLTAAWAASSPLSRRRMSTTAGWPRPRTRRWGCCSCRLCSRARVSSPSRRGAPRTRSRRRRTASPSKRASPPAQPSTRSSRTSPSRRPMVPSSPSPSTPTCRCIRRKPPPPPRWPSRRSLTSACAPSATARRAPSSSSTSRWRASKPLSMNASSSSTASSPPPREASLIDNRRRQWRSSPSGVWLVAPMVRGCGWARAACLLSCGAGARQVRTRSWRGAALRPTCVRRARLATSYSRSCANGRPATLGGAANQGEKFERRPRFLHDHMYTLTIS
mmetsp:Transcript_18566/g.55530  ORF Transcript_18566/g.55530 Transcript_18566/m.55530 type:complete len:406 (+) Transcript_18566:395-1612(+)